MPGPSAPTSLVGSGQPLTKHRMKPFFEAVTSTGRRKPSSPSDVLQPSSNAPPAALQRVKKKATALSSMTHMQQLQHLIDTRPLSQPLPPLPTPAFPLPQRLPPLPNPAHTVMATMLSLCVMRLCSCDQKVVESALLSIATLPLWMKATISRQVTVFQMMRVASGDSGASMLVHAGCLREIQLQLVGGME